MRHLMRCRTSTASFRRSVLVRCMVLIFSIESREYACILEVAEELCRWKGVSAAADFTR